MSHHARLQLEKGIEYDANKATGDSSHSDQTETRFKQCQISVSGSVFHRVSTQFG